MITVVYASIIIHSTPAVIKKQITSVTRNSRNPDGFIVGSIKLQDKEITLKSIKNGIPSVLLEIIINHDWVLNIDSRYIIMMNTF